MSPPAGNGRGGGRFGSSPSSTGTVPKSNSRMNDNSGTNRRSNPEHPHISAATASTNPQVLRQHSQELERLLLEQQAKLRSLNGQQENVLDTSSNMALAGAEHPDYLTESLQDLQEKLQLLQVLNNGSENRGYDFSPRLNQSTRFELHNDHGRQELMENLRRDIQTQWHFLEKKQQFENVSVIVTYVLVLKLFSLLPQKNELMN